jgi:thiol-disulfide isomerase/thioredoxin
MNKNFLVLLIVGIAVLGFLGRYWYKTPSVSSGNAAPEIKGKLLNGESFELKELRGSYVLIDFWGSWCPPCIEELPKVKAFYDTEKAKGKKLEILSIGIEKDSAAWKSRIEYHNLYWKYHISDMKMLQSPIAKEYGIRVIPSKILLNPEGKIIGINPDFQQLAKLLDLNI